MGAILIIVAIAAGYLLGSISPSYFLTRWIAKIDLRTMGSGNLGFTNACRALGWKIAVWALLFDLLKGLVPALLFTRLLGLDPANGIGSEGAILAIAVSPVLGHVFPFYLDFKGGKGVATCIGVFIAIAPWSMLCAAVVGFALLAATRYMSVASMGGAAALALAIVFLTPGRPLLIGFAFLAAAAIVVLHRSNIQRILNGTEHKLGSSNAQLSGLDEATPEGDAQERGA